MKIVLLRSHFRRLRHNSWITLLLVAHFFGRRDLADKNKKMKSTVLHYKYVSSCQKDSFFVETQGATTIDERRKLLHVPSIENDRLLPLLQPNRKRKGWDWFVKMKYIRQANPGRKILTKAESVWERPTLQPAFSVFGRVSDLHFKSRFRMDDLQYIPAAPRWKRENVTTVGVECPRIS